MSDLESRSHDDSTGGVCTCDFLEGHESAIHDGLDLADNISHSYSSLVGDGEGLNPLTSLLCDVRYPSGADELVCPKLSPHEHDVVLSEVACDGDVLEACDLHR